MLRSILLMVMSVFVSAECWSGGISQIPASAMGSYHQLGYNFATGTLDGRVGFAESGVIPLAPDLKFENRVYITFDLSTISQNIQQATLKLNIENYLSQGPGEFMTNPFGWTVLSNPQESFAIYSVETSLPDLLFLHGNPGTSPGQPNPNGLPIHGDLGGGTLYGGFSVNASAVGSTLMVQLNAAGIAALNAGLGNPFALAIAFDGPSFSGVQGQFGAPLVRQYVDFAEGSELQLTTIPEPAITLFGAFVWLGTALLRVRRGHRVTKSVAVHRNQIG